MPDMIYEVVEEKFEKYSDLKMFTVPIEDVTVKIRHIKGSAYSSDGYYDFVTKSTGETVQPICTFAGRLKKRILFVNATAYLKYIDKQMKDEDILPPLRIG